MVCMEVAVLGSCSKGNSTFIKCGNTKILIDVGYSMKKIKEKLEEIDESIEEIDAILITHEHSDHVGGLGAILRKYNIPTYINYGSYVAIEDKMFKIDNKLFNYIDEGKFRINDINITSLKLSHDANNCFGFKIEYKDISMGYVTDTGYLSNVVKEELKNIDIIAVESNYEYENLMLGSYPANIKSRINSKKGHLSNLEALRLLKQIASDKLKKVYVMHISQENNDIGLILNNMDIFKKYVYDEYKVDVDIDVIGEEVTSKFKVIK